MMMEMGERQRQEVKFIQFLKGGLLNFLLTWGP